MEKFNTFPISINGVLEVLPRQGKEMKHKKKNWKETSIKQSPVADYTILHRQ